MPAELLTTHEVAGYLRIKERKVYELVAERRIPCSRVAGKWLFPRHLIDRWVAEGIGNPAVRHLRPDPAPNVIAGSHDPLLEWAIAESGCGIALLPGGSLDGLDRVADGDAMAALSHVIDGNSGEYNVPLVRERLLHLDIVVLEWAKRTQGLIVAPDNPLGLEGVQDLQNKSARIVLRQNQAGSHVLLLELLAQAGVDFDDLKFSSRRARSEMELGLAVLEERADAGLAIAAVAHQLRLGFVPLHEERCDIVIRRREFFESPFECLMAFTRDPAFTQRARELGGYDVSAVGRVAYNSP